MAIFSNLIERTIARLSMTPGMATQLYSEDTIAEMIQHKFDVLFDEAFWGQFCSWQTYTLDGMIGVVTTDLTDILKKFSDIQVIFRGDTSVKLSEFSQQNINPNLVKGTSPKFYEPYNSASKVFRVLPVTSTGSITMRLRTKPAAFTEEDEVNFDDQALILGATYDYLEDDGTNPAATDKFRAMFEARVAQLKRLHSTGAVALDPTYGYINTSMYVEI